MLLFFRLLLQKLLYTTRDISRRRPTRARGQSTGPGPRGPPARAPARAGRTPPRSGGAADGWVGRPRAAAAAGAWPGWSRRARCVGCDCRRQGQWSGVRGQGSEVRVSGQGSGVSGQRQWSVVSGKGQRKGKANLASTPPRARGPAMRRGLWCTHSLSQQRCHASPRSRSMVTWSRLVSGLGKGSRVRIGVGARVGVGVRSRVRVRVRFLDRLRVLGIAVQQSP